MPKAKTSVRSSTKAGDASGPRARRRGGGAKNGGAKSGGASRGGASRGSGRRVGDAARSDKASEILDAAEHLFATRAYHEVLLDEIAARARVGKGTVYLHWSSKEDVYLAVVRRGFDGVMSRVEAELPSLEGRAWAQMEVVVSALVDFSFAHPGVFQMMRSGVVKPEDPALLRTRARLAERIEGVMRAGIAQRAMRDPCPALTTQFIFSCVRGASLYPVKGMTRELLTGHILHVLRHGIAGGGA